MDRARSLALLAIALGAIAAACSSPAGVTAPPPPPPNVAFHDSTPFPLTGKHITTPCASCHTDTLYATTPTACVTCHGNRHGGTQRTECSRCHNTNRWV